MSALVLAVLSAIGLLLAPFFLLFALRAGHFVVPAVVLLVAAFLATLPHRPRVDWEAARRPTGSAQMPR
jgi:hypothetical protein